MDAKNTLIFNRGTEAANKKSYEDFKCVCLEGGIPSFQTPKTKGMVSQTWPGEDGEDAYFPATLSFEPIDWEVKMATMTEGDNTAKANLNSLITYLKGGGVSSSLKIYSPYLSDGRQKCYLTEIGSVEQSKTSDGSDLIEFTLKFRITDPTTQIALS